MNKAVLIVMILVGGCRSCSSEQPSGMDASVADDAGISVSIEPGEMTVLEAPDYVEPSPVVVAPSFPLVERHAAATGWRARCRGGFVTLAGGQVLSCRP